jgi:hypothetical protein
MVRVGYVHSEKPRLIKRFFKEERKPDAGERCMPRKAADRCGKEAALGLTV